MKSWELLQPHHGVNVILSGLHSKNSAGIGEFLDLLLLIDWCNQVGMDLIQLLPINDSGKDPSPYNPLSSCALNPHLISLYALKDIGKELQERLSELQKLSQSKRVHYEKVMEQKIDWLQDYFTQNGSTTLESSAFKQFVSENPWLGPYSLYKDSQNPLFVQFLQFLCCEQMLQVSRYARKNRVLLMGDIPILISQESVDVKLQRDLFQTELSAGSPPDAFNREGQSWGFPLYNWDAMKADHYTWWKNRLAYASHFYDLFRIDHIVGIFRIWAIPPGRPSKEGFFIPGDENLAITQGKERLEMMINASTMLPIGEDLGTVPPRVREIMRDLKICGTKVVRWERNWNSDQSFIPFENYPTLSLTTLSTHDTETLELWWKNHPDEAKPLADMLEWSYDPRLTPSQRHALLYKSHHTPSLFHINLLQEYLSFFPELTWQNPEDERINVTERKNPENWLYRYRPSLEELANHATLKEKIHSILT